jgi:hypothetical protein
MRSNPAPKPEAVDSQDLVGVFAEDRVWLCQFRDLVSIFPWEVNSLVDDNSFAKIMAPGRGATLVRNGKRAADVEQALERDRGWLQRRFQQAPAGIVEDDTVPASEVPLRQGGETVVVGWVHFAWPSPIAAKKRVLMGGPENGGQQFSHADVVCCELCVGPLVDPDLLDL